MAIAVDSLPNPPPLTDEQKKLVKDTVPILAQHGAEIARLFYRQMITENAMLKNMFNHSKQQRGDQAEALARAVYTYAAHIDDLTPLLPAIERLCHKHASLNVQPEQYAIVGKYLLGAITQVIGADVFNAELYDAWGAAYWHLARLCFGREEQLYSDASWRGWKAFVVAKKVAEAEDIVSFYLESTNGEPLPTYKPGQYISVQKFIQELGYNQSRQYSLSGSPCPSHFRISVRRDRGIQVTDPATGGKIDTSSSGQLGWMSNLLHDKVNVGDTVELTSPFGDFFLDDDDSPNDSPVVFLSAGVGITPLISMLHSALSGNHRRRKEVGWVQVVRSRATHAFHDEISHLLDTHKDVVVRQTVFYSNPEADAVRGRDYDFSGRMSVDRVPEGTLYLAESTAQYFVCGPASFMRDICEGLLAKGVDYQRIHAEVFGQGAVPM
ncbi:globin-like protein [Cytidiella melzeri]|nr:globin-like protein [Cytidiella melzeri]